MFMATPSFVILVVSPYVHVQLSGPQASRHVAALYLAHSRRLKYDADRYLFDNYNLVGW